MQNVKIWQGEGSGEGGKREGGKRGGEDWGRAQKGVGRQSRQIPLNHQNKWENLCQTITCRRWVGICLHNLGNKNI